MRRASVHVHGVHAGFLEELEEERQYRFVYLEDYEGPPVSLTMPVEVREYEFFRFPAVFDGWLPEGAQLEALLRSLKLDETDLFGQLLAVGGDLVGAVTVREAE